MCVTCPIFPIYKFPFFNLKSWLHIIEVTVWYKRNIFLYSHLGDTHLLFLIYVAVEVKPFFMIYDTTPFSTCILNNRNPNFWRSFENKLCLGITLYSHYIACTLLLDVSNFTVFIEWWICNNAVIVHFYMNIHH